MTDARSMHWRLARRFEAGLFALAAAALAAVAASAFVSSLYTGIAADVAVRTRGRVDVAAAASLGIELAPWRSAAHLQLAQAESARGHLDDARRSVESALHLALADGRSWAYLGRLRGAAGQYDERLTATYASALARGPNAWNIQESVALDGVLRWRYGGEELRALWLGSMRYMIRHRREPFLLHVVRIGRDPYFCATAGAELRLSQWCAGARRTRQACSQDGLAADALAWCRRVGFLRGS